MMTFPASLMGRLLYSAPSRFVLKRRDFWRTHGRTGGRGRPAGETKQQLIKRLWDHSRGCSH